MQALPLNLKGAIVIVLGAIVGYFLISTIVSTRLANLEESYERSLVTVEEALVAQAQTVARIGPDQVADSIIIGCSTESEAQFNLLLSRLNRGLEPAELGELDVLFARCGYQDFQRKAILVIQFAQLHERYNAQLTGWETVTGQIESLWHTRDSQWEELVALEQVQVTQFGELARQQELIIKALLAGGTTESESVQAILQTVQELRDSMAVRSAQISELREMLITS